MRSFIPTIAVVLAGVANAANFATIPESYVAGFSNPSIVSSAAGHAICIQGSIPVTASAMNLKLNYQEPANQSVVTETILENLQLNSTLAQMVVAGRQNISGTYDIYSELCFPAASGVINATTLQFLIHGVGFDRNYWDFAANYSYADYAALAGYTTFFFDRLGIGLSDHPDPIQVVQAELEVVIAHTLIQQLRDGGIASTKFEHVVGVGHSFGSIQTVALTAQYPKDLDAAVLTGYSTSSAGNPIFFAGLDLSIASQNSPLRFSTLPNGYMVSNSISNNQFGFLRLPNFDPLILNKAEATKQTLSIGELFSIAAVAPTAPLSYTGPIDVVDGQNDLPFCQANCLLPVNQAAAVKPALYPHASNSSQSYIVPGNGHGINLHYNAPLAYQQIQNFVKANGL